MRTGNPGINRPESEGFVSIGYITGTHGIKGDVKVLPLSDMPGRFDSLSRVYVFTKKGIKREYLIHGIKEVKGRIILSFLPPVSVSESEDLVGGYIKVPEDEVPELSEDTYYHFEIIGMEVFSEDGTYLGKIEDIFSTGSNDVYVVKDAEKELLIPAVHYVVKNVDVAENRMVVALIEGLL
ncbi:MAG: 16S rRNA processing protein RimM [Nitrospirae bacterium]|nr:16S rRNA processing protein RimM [Nitrospirota bacterium]